MFPRLLVAIWAIDLAMQLGIASAVAGTEGLPPTVADALHTLLDGNVKKVLISVVPVAALSAAVEAGQRHLPPPRRGLNRRLRELGRATRRKFAERPAKRIAKD